MTAVFADQVEGLTPSIPRFLSPTAVDNRRKTSHFLPLGVSGYESRKVSHTVSVGASRGEGLRIKVAQ